jgi:hypothetical protein
VSLLPLGTFVGDVLETSLEISVTFESTLISDPRRLPCNYASFEPAGWERRRIKRPVRQIPLMLIVERIKTAAYERIIASI